MHCQVQFRYLTLVNKYKPFFLFSLSVNLSIQGLRTKNYILQKIACTIKNRLHSRQQPCHSPRLTVIGIGLRELFLQKSSLAIGQSGLAALPLPRVPPFLCIIRFFSCIHFSCVIPVRVCTYHLSHGIAFSDCRTCTARRTLQKKYRSAFGGESKSRRGFPIG